MPSARRLPWVLIVRDASGQALAYVYFEGEKPGGVVSVSLSTKATR
jgi:hypothetical protein